MTAPHYDDRDWPLFRVVLSSAEMSDDEFMAYVATMDSLSLRDGGCAVLLDARAAPPLSAKRRQILSEHANAFFERHPGAMVGLAIVMSSALQRGIFTAIHWLTRQPQHVHAFASISEAEAWLAERLLQRGTRTPCAAGA